MDSLSQASDATIFWSNFRPPLIAHLFLMTFKITKPNLRRNES